MIPQFTPPPAQPKNENKKEGLKSVKQIQKKKANIAKQKKEEKKKEIREEMTPAQMKARQRELEENSDMMAAADTFGFDDDEEGGGEEKPAKKEPGFFDEMSSTGDKQMYGKFANKLSAKLLGKWYLFDKLFFVFCGGVCVWGENCRDDFPNIKRSIGLTFCADFYVLNNYSSNT